MTLVDAGPLVALIDVADLHHERCANEAASLPVAPMLTTWPCFTEAMHLVGRKGGFPFQEKLWQMHFQGKLDFCNLSRKDAARCSELMQKYQDMPMDFADASLVAIAENNKSLRKVFTIDNQFHAFRLADGHFLEIVP
jgi:predicted nucleic acid-binding protein